MDLVTRLRYIERAEKIGENSDLLTIRAAARRIEELSAAIERVRQLCAAHEHVCSCAYSEALILPSQVIAALDGREPT